MRTRLPPILLGVVALLIAACGPEPVQRQAVSVDDGLHVTGHVDGRSVNVSVGEPEVLLGTCDPRRPDLRELCIEARTVDGERFGIVVNNPSDLVAGDRLEVRSGCPEAGCEGIALLEVDLGGDRFRATDGTLTVSAAGPRYSARFTVRIHDDTLTGGFDVLPPRGG